MTTMRYWYNHNFKAYLQKQGIELNLDYYRFIENTIKNMPQNEQRLILRDYCNELAPDMLVEPKV